MEIRRGNITAETGPERTEICNGRVRVSFNLVDGGYVQEFYAADHRGRFRLLLSSVHRNLIPSSEHRVCASPMIVGERVHLFTVTRDSLRMPYSEVRVVHHDDASVAVELSGNALGHKLKCTISLEDSSNVAHVVYEDEIQRSWSSPLIEYFMASYAFVPDGKPLPVGTQPDYVWVPNLRPAMDHVIGDCFFHAPAAIVRISRLAVAIVPDLRLLATHRPMPSCLDVDLTNGLLHAPLVSYGFCGYEQVHDANYCRHDLSHSRRLCENRLKFGFHLILDADCPAEAAHGQVSRFIWLNYGSRYFGKETKASSDSRSGLQDKPTIKARRTSYALFEHPDAQAACGMYAEGMRIGDNRLIDQARALKDLLLTSPQDKGLFPTRYDPVRKLWLGCQADIGGATYNTVECSTELYWLLEWHKRIEPDIRTVERAQSYADFLLAARQRSGAIPAWYGPDHIPLSPARSGSQTAPSALFLAQLAEVTEDPKYAQAAEHSARFVIRNLVPGRTYEDHNLLNPVNRTTLECTDPHTGARPVGGRSMLWIAFLLVELHRIMSRLDTRQSSVLDYLKTGLVVFDELCLLQSVWTKPWAPEHLPLGLCARGNVGALCDPEFTAEFARCAMRYGAVTGERDYFERGAAALTAVLDKPGLSAVSRARVLATTAAIEAEYGSIYVNLAKKWAVPLNGWKVAQVDISPDLVAIRVEPGSGCNSGRIVFGGLRARAHNVRINGRTARYSREQMESGIDVAGKVTTSEKVIQLKLMP